MQEGKATDIMKIDLDAVLRKRLPRHYRYIPHCVVSWLERTICQDKLNELLQVVAGKQGVEATDATLKHLGISLEVSGMDNLSPTGRYVMASNHPLGGLDGLALISLMGNYYGHDGIRFMVNDLLMAIEPLRPIFLPVNKFGRQSRSAAELIEDCWNGPRQMLTFPAGLCSRMMPDGSIHDLQWHKHFVSRAIESHRDVVPIYVEEQNSRFFYRFAKIRKQLKLKFNIEMIYLPREMFKRTHSTLHIHIGKPVKWSTLDARHPAQEAQRLCNLAYSLGGAMAKTAKH